MTAADVVVIGAGVVGLTTAITLAEAGRTTRVLAAAPPSGTTSAAAGAIWGPVLCGPDDQCYEWASTGLSVLTELADETGATAGVHLISGREVAQEAATPPRWTELLPDRRILGPAELPAGFASGWSYTAPAIIMGVYLEYLLNRYTELGGAVTAGTVTDLASVDAPTVVNCTGIGARTLVADDDLVPVRGQVVVVENPGITEFYIDHTLHGTDYVYAFPHGDTIVLGGTSEHGATDLPPRPAVTERILRDAAAAIPALRGARVLAERVGLRPYRPRVRLEAEPLAGGRVLWHNYGHGGAGVTLSWGCAREVAAGVLAATV